MITALPYPIPPSSAQLGRQAPAREAGTAAPGKHKSQVGNHLRWLSILTLEGTKLNIAAQSFHAAPCGHILACL